MDNTIFKDVVLDTTWETTQDGIKYIRDIVFKRQLSDQEKQFVINFLDSSRDLPGQRGTTKLVQAQASRNNKEYRLHFTCHRVN
jgi:hypothetical protein